jgi:hypothetical protein
MGPDAGAVTNQTTCGQLVRSLENDRQNVIQSWTIENPDSIRW